MAPSVHSQRGFPDGTTTTRLLADPPQQAHSVHFYETPEALFEKVARFLGGGLDSGDRVLVVATASHRESITERLDPELVSRAIATKQLALLDAHETLEAIMVGDAVDTDHFHRMLDRVVSDLRGGAAGTRVRAYGEMVDVLWRTGRSSAALRLEEAWGDAIERHDFALLCAYAMGHFYGEANMAGLSAVCDRHTHVVGASPAPEESVPSIQDDASVEERIRSLEAELRHRKGLEAALRKALHDRSCVEAELRDSIGREREAREKAEQSDAFKEQFIAILGHDLRNPLNTILTTARLMLMRGELPADSSRRLDRVVVSGVRMQRMIEQILDVTSDRLDDGIHIAVDPAQDVGALAATVVDEARAANPRTTIDLVVDGPCIATVDGQRFEQVLRTLVGNALAHGDASRPVRVLVLARSDTLAIEVHNFGPPIEEEERAFLFEPLKRSRKSKGRSEGLGLGLYISQRIAHAHGGALDVETSDERGTTFRLTIPRTRQ